MGCVYIKMLVLVSLVFFFFAFKSTEEINWYIPFILIFPSTAVRQ